MPHNVLHGDAYGALFIRHCLENFPKNSLVDRVFEKVYWLVVLVIALYCLFYASQVLVSTCPPRRPGILLGKSCCFWPHPYQVSQLYHTRTIPHYHSEVHVPGGIIRVHKTSHRAENTIYTILFIRDEPLKYDP